MDMNIQTTEQLASFLAQLLTVPGQVAELQQRNLSLRNEMPALVDQALEWRLADGVYLGTLADKITALVLGRIRLALVPPSEAIPLPTPTLPVPSSPGSPMTPPVPTPGGGPGNGGGGANGPNPLAQADPADLQALDGLGMRRLNPSGKHFGKELLIELRRWEPRPIGVDDSRLGAVMRVYGIAPASMAARIAHLDPRSPRGRRGSNPTPPPPPPPGPLTEPIRTPDPAEVKELKKLLKRLANKPPAEQETALIGLAIVRELTVQQLRNIAGWAEARPRRARRG